MTRATYNTDNTITEQSGMEAPRPPRNGIHDYDWDIYLKKRTAYNKAVASCRTIPCSPGCRGLFENGKVYEEGKDYEVRPVCIHTGSFEYAGCIEPSCEKCAMTAFPLPVKSEDDLWEEVCEVFKDYVYDNGEYDFGPAVMLLKMRGYSLTKR